jgi:ribosome biogenesis GTPase
LINRMKDGYEEGLIVRALGGFYDVETADGVYTCKARGLFRKTGQSPLVGDRVRIQRTGEAEGYVEEIFERKNSLVRPAVANLDRLVMVVSILSPPPNLLVLDKLLALAEHQGIEPVVVAAKSDLCGGQAGCEELCGIYRRAGFETYAVSAETGEGVAELAGALAGKLSCFCGNTGAGKSSLLNALDPSLALRTGEISQKLGRGRHTTRHAQLYALAGGGYIADTPGFSAVEISRYAVIYKDQLQDCFREFAPYRERCRFTGCSHTCEQGCAVLAAVKAGGIAASRHESYRAMYEDAKQIKEWERR